MQMTKIIYSLRIMCQLAAKGHTPIATMPNPNYPNLLCWVFQRTPEFTKDLNELLGGNNNE